MPLQVLVVEDDIDLAATIVDYLSLEDMQLEHAINGEAGLSVRENCGVTTCHRA